MTRSIRQQPDQVLSASFYLLLAFLFFIFSATMELIPGLRLIRPQLILGTLGMVAILASGQFVKVLHTRIGLAVAAFTVWFIACIPFGFWPGGSFTVFSERWYKAALTYVLTAGLLTSLDQAKRLFHTIAYATGIMAMLAVLKNQRDNTGRLGLFNTRYGNANDLAWTLLIGLVFLGYLYTGGSRAQKAIALILSLPVLLALSRTGSREGMLGTLILCGFVFMQASKATKLKLAVAIPVILVVLLMVAPPAIRMRYTTWFGDVNQTVYGSWQMAATGSTEARITLLKDSLRLTAMHPLLGVGPGNFPVAQDELAQARGQKSAWHVTHNSYTEVSSEMGIPGFVIFVVFLISCFKILNKIIRTKTQSRTWDELQVMARTIRTAFVIFLVIAFFSSLTYNTDVQILAGLTTALWFMAQKQRAIDRATAAQLVSAVSASDTLQPVAVGQY